jgi:hypothetical protein
MFFSTTKFGKFSNKKIGNYFGKFFFPIPMQIHYVYIGIYMEILGYHKNEKTKDYKSWNPPFS